MQGKEHKVTTTSGKNKLKTDTVLKNFWRDNAWFADLFNAVLFHGDHVIKPETLKEADTDFSAILKILSENRMLVSRCPHAGAAVFFFRIISAF